MKHFRHTLICLVGCMLSAASHAEGVLPPLQRAALMTTAASHAMTTAIAKAGPRLIAAGERGIVLLSDDAGISWRQAKTPVSITLTALRFVTPQRGWASGNAGVILHTRDGGETWTLQLDGKKVIALLNDQAKKTMLAAPDDVRSQHLQKQAAQFAQDGADKPFLDLYFSSETVGTAVGAYGLIFHTEDGGATWVPWMERLPNPKGLHVYTIAGYGDTILVAGEQGLVARSTDAGRQFTTLTTPYPGSFFSVTLLKDEHLLLAGLRGTVYRSNQQAVSPSLTFTKLDSPVSANINAVTTLANGKLLLATQAGLLLTAEPTGTTLRPAYPGQQPIPFLSGMVQNDDGSIVTVGLRGPQRLAMGTRK